MFHGSTLQTVKSSLRLTDSSAYVNQRIHIA